MKLIRTFNLDKGMPAQHLPLSQLSIHLPEAASVHGLNFMPLEQLRSHAASVAGAAVGDDWLSFCLDIGNMVVQVLQRDIYRSFSVSAVEFASCAHIE